MKLHELQPSKGGRSKARKRVGRGTGTGMGKTSGKGHKGQNARAGKGTRVGYEGGQTPLFQRLPKRGFTNIFSKEPAILNIEDLNVFDDGKEITPQLLIEEGLIKKAKAKDGVKILGNGDLEKKLTVKAHQFSRSAKEKIEAQGGKAEVI